MRPVRFAASSVQLAGLVLAGVFLVMNRASVRFRQAALFIAAQRCLSNQISIAHEFPWTESWTESRARDGRMHGVSWLQSVIDGCVSGPFAQQPARRTTLTANNVCQLAWPDAHLRSLLLLR